MMPPWSLVDVMETVAQSREDSTGLEELLVRFAQTARDSIPRTDYASCLIRYDDGQLETMAATDPVISPADDLQYELREGPCYDALTDGQVASSGDLGHDPHWPRYGPRASALGFRSQLAVRVHCEHRASIGLNLYSRDREAFGHPLEAAGVMMRYAGVVMSRAGDLSRIRSTIKARQVMVQAVDIMMERYGMAEEQASELLNRLSLDTLVGPRELALQIVDQAS